MRVKMLIGRHAGNVEEVPFHVGQVLLDQGQAEAVADEPAEVETATNEPEEHAVSRRGKVKPKK